MSKVKVALGVVAVLVVAWIVAAPYITVYQMKSAAESRDGEALSEHIDFPSVRQSLKDQMNAMFLKEMAQDKEMKDNPFAALGTAFAGMMVNKMVDAFVTPAGITQMMAGEKPQPDPKRSSTQPATASEGYARKPWSGATMGYESFNKFVVRVKDEKGGEITFVLRREGIGWKLTQIIMPLD